MCELGRCPKCEGEDLDYGKSELDGESLAYHVTCRKCGWVGYEVFSIEFTHYSELDGTTCEGCTNSLEVLLGTDDFPFEINVACVSWIKFYNKTARIALEKIYEELGKMVRR